MYKRMENNGRRKSRSFGVARKGGVVGVVVVLLLIASAVGGFYAWRKSSSGASKKVNLIFATVERGTFIHEVNGKGSAESAKNVDVASQVEGQATVIFLIDEGSDVKKGDLLVELDSSDIEEKLDSQVVTTNTSRATLNSSRADLRSKIISLEEYVQGTFEQTWMEYENSIFEAEQTRKQQSDSARFTERLLNLNYSTELQLEIDKVAEEKAKNTLDLQNLKKTTLLKYTSEKQITSLMSDIETASAKVDSDKNSYNINLSRENRLRMQAKNCKILAPQDGQVVYANQDSRRMSEADMIKEGSVVRQRQVLIRLPDKTQMQVKTMINESNISSVKEGMAAKITFDSIPNRELDGEVVKVNLYPEIVWMSSAKDYVTLVKIKDELEELRSGLTAQVRIIADRQENVLMVPVHCVTEYGKKTYCLTFNNGVWGYKEVLLGASNEKQVIVLKGLEEGEQVVSGARNYRDNVQFPDPNAPSEFENDPEYQEHLVQAKAEAEKNAQAEATAAVGDAPGAPGAPGAGFPGGFPGGLPSGGAISPEMIAGFAEKIKSGEVPKAILDQIPPQILAGIMGSAGNGAGAGDSDEQRKKDAEIAECDQTIKDRLARDAKIAGIEPFFTRTVMEMQRELLSAINTKASSLQARIAARQAEITRRQEDVELLQKTSALDGGESEEVKEKIAKLLDEIRQLRGDSDADPLEKIVYLDKIDWNKYVHANDITRDGLILLTQDLSDVFNQIFPNSVSLDVVKKESTTDLKDDQVVLAGIEADNSVVKVDPTEVEDDDEFDDDQFDVEDDVLFPGASKKDYSAFVPLFDDWDTSGEGSLKPTEFVIGFFSDRKSFQDSESDETIEELFTEFAEGDDAAEETSLETAERVARRILSEREDGATGSRRGGNRGGNRGGRGGFPGGGPGGNFAGGGFPGGAPGGAPSGAFAGAGAPNGEAVGGNFPGGARPEGAQRGGRPSETVAQNGDGDKGGDSENAPRPPRPAEPIKSLAEATSLRQAVALYISSMDFNGDGTLQKSEFVIAYNGIKDVASKLFSSTSSGVGDGGMGGMGGMGGGMPGPPPR